MLSFSAFAKQNYKKVYENIADKSEKTENELLPVRAGLRVHGPVDHLGWTKTCSFLAFSAFSFFSAVFIGFPILLLRES